MRIDEVDPITEDNQKRLDSLKLQDGDRRERRSTHDRQNSDPNTSSHERSESGGSTTAVVGMVLDTGKDDYRNVQTLPDEYASHLS